MFARHYFSDGCELSFLALLLLSFLLIRWRPRSSVFFYDQLLTATLSNFSANPFHISTSQFISVGLGKLEFSVQVLTTGHWPTYKSYDTINLPPAMLKCTQVSD